MDNARSQQAALKLSAIATAIALVIGTPMATQAQEDDDQNLKRSSSPARAFVNATTTSRRIP